MSCYLGVDGGNSKTIVLVATKDGSIVGTARAGCTDIYGAASVQTALNDLDHAVSAALAMAQITHEQIAAACFSLAGADWPEDYALLRTHLAGRRFGQIIDVCNDAMGALRAGVTEGTGVVIACGTGVASAARNMRGDFWHTSSWQEWSGAGCLVGKALSAVYRAELGIDPPTGLTEPMLAYFGQPTVEALNHCFGSRTPAPFTGAQMARAAPIVLVQAAAGDPAAAALVAEQGKRLMEYALACARKVELAPPYHVVLNGGLFRDAGGTLVEAIRAHVPDGVTLVRARYEPAVGALLHAFERGGCALDDALLARIEATCPPPSLFSTADGTR